MYDPKPGYQTTEFWLSLLAATAPYIAPLVPPHWAVIASTVASAAYAVARGLAKQPTGV